MADLPTITHVALKLNGIVWSLPRPYRHQHVYAQANLLWRPEHSNGRDREDCEHDVQGFLDSNGRFLTRAEARELALANGQLGIDKRYGVLTSEDLW